MHSGVWARQKRRKNPKQRRTMTTSGTPSGQRTTPVDAATRTGPQDTTLAGSSGGEYDELITALRPQCPRGTEDSEWLYPEALADLANQGQLPEHSGIHSASRDAFWSPGKTEAEESSEAEENEDERWNPFWTADYSCGCSHLKRPTGDNAGRIFTTPGSEDQEV
ncbi:hypothetical protein NDU88_003964 [Pleurodeles waltl]|uniref:Uncharacterized protein n=1 Tax=Pleurodeles waltl TaxID=8319 RepID=A0AAV7SHE0_PLEWA|nr:hypothetical protein NDU88_003964 [Pleurodeles waltl]